MIRNINLEGRIALVTSILLLALWAPITTNAQPSAEPESGKYTVTTDIHECAHCNMLQSAKGRPCPHAPQHSNTRNTDIESMVGFAEVDPAADLFENLDSGAVSSSHEVGRDYLGFAEADPADVGAVITLIAPQLAERSVWQNPVGFAETDTADIGGAMELIRNEILVTCQHMGTSSSYPSANELSGFTHPESHS